VVSVVRVQPEIVPVVSVVRVQPVIVQVVLPEHQVGHQVAHREVGQVGDLIQLVVVAILLAHLVNQVAGHQRVVSQSVQSVKSLTT
jgi:hypothetical protein